VTGFQTSFRPIWAAPVVTTTAFSPVVTSSAACCDACAATVTSFAPTTSACCGATVSGSPYFGEATSVPELSSRDGSAGYRGAAPEQSGAGGAGGAQSQEKSVIEDNEQGNGQGTDAENSNWSPPPLRDPRLEGLSDEPAVKTASHSEPAAAEVKLTNSVRPRQATPDIGRGIIRSNPPKKSIPSRTEREAMWTAVVD
jgi:hypothetical protein